MKTIQHRLRMFISSTLCCVALLAANASLEADDVFTLSGVQGGLVVQVGCGDAESLAARRPNDRYLVHGLDTDQANVDAARALLIDRELYGPITVDLFDGENLPYVDNLVNLLIVRSGSEVAEDEILRVLSPNGVACIKTGGDLWRKIVKPQPDDTDDWTHFLHDASNNAVADDEVVGPPRRFQWVAGPKWARSHDHLSTTSAVVSSGGRIFSIIDEAPAASVAIPSKWMLVARDAYNGVLLWKREVSPWEGQFRDFRTGPPELQRLLVAVDDRVYVTLGYGSPVTALDAATGETVLTYPNTENALEILHHNERLFLVVGDRTPDNTDGAAKPVNPQPEDIWHWWPIYNETLPLKRIMTFDAASGELVWEKDDADTVEMMPTTPAASEDRFYFHNGEEILALSEATGEEIWRTARPVSRSRPSWSAPTLVVHDGTVLCGDRAAAPLPEGYEDLETPIPRRVDSTGGVAPEGKLTAFNAADGAPLWESTCRECYNSPADVLVADDLVWTGNLVKKPEPGITQALDLRSGEIVRERTRDQDHFNIIMSHHRCYRNKATSKYLVLGRDGVEYIDLETGEGHGNHWTRGACQYGVMPCNGLTYVPPHSCACHVESKLNGYNALSAEPVSDAEPLTPEERLTQGPAFGEIDLAATGTNPDADWSTYRADGTRSGLASTAIPTELQLGWEAVLPKATSYSAPVIADGRVFVACIDADTLCALDAESGELEWTFTAGGRIDSPPTILGNAAIFGSADGSIYCLRTSDGALAWRCLAAPCDRRIVSYGRVESSWPVHGNVLAIGDTIYASVGRTTFIEGGIRLVALKADTGEIIMDSPIEKAALPDVLSTDGENLYLRHRRFTLDGADQPTNVPHLYSPAGFLDGDWWHRTYWMVNTQMNSGWGSWPNQGLRVPSGRLLVLDDANVYGFGRLNQYHRNGTHVGLGRAKYLLYGAALSVDNSDLEPWSTGVPVFARSMVLSGEMLFLAGPPDDLEYAPEEIADPYHITSEEQLVGLGESLAGHRGASLLTVSTADGSTLAETPLPAPPVWDGMAAAQGYLYLTLRNGTVVRMQGEE